MNKERSVRQASMTSCMMAGAVALGIFGGAAAAFAAGDDTAPAGRTIAYAWTDNRWAVYETKDGKAECPEGVVQLGPREQYKLQFPEDGTKRKIVDTVLVREKDVFFPNAEPDRFPFHEAGGKIAIGIDLDGKTKPTDFTSPDGKPGIDNQMYRVLGCVGNYRSAGSVLNFDRTLFKSRNINRVLIELTDVDSLVNDNDVTVAMYRGRDQLLNDATGNTFTPGGTQRIDVRFGKIFMNHTKGKIVNGVLITQPMDINMPHEAAYEEASYDWIRDSRFEFKLTSERAEGVVGGYADIESMYHSRNRSWGTHHEAYGQQSQPSVYKELLKWADAYPDPKTGRNTAISAAYESKLVQVRVLHPDKEISQLRSAPSAKQFADSNGAPQAAK